MADGSRIPRVVLEASALRSLPLGAADGFVLSRIDGKASERELAGLTGLPPMQIQASLDKLLSLKAISFEAAPALPPKAAPGAAPTSAASTATDEGGAPKLPAAASDSKPPEGLLARAIAGIPDDAPALAEEVDLPVELRRRVLGLHSVVVSLDHYALLGIPRDADKKAVKRAYFELAAVFHPDRYFRKNLGTFKAKMETIFGKVSVAFEALADKEQRAEYDLYLGDLEKSQNVERMLRDVMAEAERAEKAILEEAGAAPSAASGGSGPASARNASSYSSVIPRAASVAPASAVPQSAPVPTPSTPPRNNVSEQLRREALAMRLKGMARPPARPVEKVAAAPAAPAAPAVATGDAMDAIRRRYDEKVEAGRVAQGKKYVTLAETAESRNDLTAAAASYRVALSFLREGEPAYAKAKEVIAKSEQTLGETYLRQAEHEEKQSHWEDSARSYGRAVKLRPLDHRAHERYANALVRASGDLHEAAQVAQKAVAMAPTVGDYRCTLATVYAAAGLLLNAKRELEGAALQFPENPNIASLLKRLVKPTP